MVAPYCHGKSTRGGEALRGVQLRRPESESKSGGFGFAKLWLVAEMTNIRVLTEPFVPDDPAYEPNDSAMMEIHCRIEPAT